MFKRLYASLIMAARMARNAALRPFRMLAAGLRQKLNLSRQLAKAVPNAVKGLTKLKLRPTRREDYVDAGPVFVAKSFLWLMALGLIILALLLCLVVWPFLASRFFTVRLPLSSPKAQTYTGRVLLYYDQEKTLLCYAGRLEAGKGVGQGEVYDEAGTLRYRGGFAGGRYEGKGEAFDEAGRPQYTGQYAQGLYEGEGTLYEQGVLRYQGGFAGGLYQGAGKLYDAQGRLELEGGFVSGMPEGAVKLYRAGKLLYEGALRDGLYEGKGKLYDAQGQLWQEGNFAAGLLDGAGMEYFPSGQVRYAGPFSLGKLEGEGVEYAASGAVRYSGGFLQGLYDGQGTLYDQQGALRYTGGFVGGVYQGQGKLMLDADSWVEGEFAGGLPSGRVRLIQGGSLRYEGEMGEELRFEGEGVLYNRKGASIYAGPFSGGCIDGAALLGLPVQSVRDALFGQAKQIEAENALGFMIQNQEVGAAVFCNFAVGEETPVVHRVFLFADGLTCGGGTVVPPEGAAGRPEEGEAMLALPAAPLLPGTRRCVRYDADAYTLRLWGEREDRPQVAEWRWRNPLPKEEAGSEEAGQEQEALAALLEQLGLGGALETEIQQEDP